MGISASTSGRVHTRADLTRPPSLGTQDIDGVEGGNSSPLTPPFSWHGTLLDETPIIRLIGEVDLATARDLERAIDAATGSRTARQVVVDLSEVCFFDSSALNALLKSRRRLTLSGITLRVVIPPDQPHIRKVFEITQLMEPLGVVETLVDALTQ